MKQSILLCAVCALMLVSCKQESPKPAQAVTFRFPQLTQTTEPMSAPAVRKVAPLTDEDGQQMTDLLLFDGSTYLLRQQNSDPNFGTVTVMLSLGEHHLHFIATRSAGLSYEDGLLKCTSLRPTFGKHYDMTVSGGSDESITLTRITGQLVITVDDEIPTGAKDLRIQVGDSYTSIDPTTFNATRIGAFDQTVGISGKVGSSGNEWKLNILVPTYGEEHETTYTLTATNTSGDIIGQATGTLTLNSNTKTLLHGNLFTGTTAAFSLSTAWNADINETF